MGVGEALGLRSEASTERGAPGAAPRTAEEQAMITSPWTSVYFRISRDGWSTHLD
jgi:hypothetical protein